MDYNWTGQIADICPAQTAGQLNKQLANQSSCCLSVGWTFNFRWLTVYT